MLARLHLPKLLFATAVLLLLAASMPTERSATLLAGSVEMDLADEEPVTEGEEDHAGPELALASTRPQVARPVQIHGGETRRCFESPLERGPERSPARGPPRT